MPKTLDRVTELQEQRQALLTEMRGVLDVAEAANRDLTAEESAEFDKRQTDADAIADRVRCLEAVGEPVEELRARLVAPEAPGDDQQGDPAPAASYREFVSREAGGRPEDRPEYREHLYRYMRDGAQIPAEFRVQSKLTAAAGANTVPTGFANLIYAVEREYGALTDLTAGTAMNTDSGETIQIPTVTAFGVATWTAEAAAFPESDDTFGQTPIGAFKLARMVRVTEELLQDASFDLEAYLAEQFGASFGVAVNTALAVGTGTGQPQGIVPNAATGVTLGTGNTTSITSDGLIDLLYSLKPVYRNRAAFLMRSTTIQAARKLKDTTNQYIWQPGLTSGQPDTLLGRPVYEDPDVPAMAANARSVACGDFGRAVQVRNVGGIQIQRLNERYADVGQVGFRAYRRMDARVVNTEAAKVLINSAT